MSKQRKDDQLTKRELFAALLYSHFLDNHCFNAKEAARVAIRHADYLLEELDAVRKAEGNDE